MTAWEMEGLDVMLQEERGEVSQSVLLTKKSPHTILIIWGTFLNPLAAVAPGAYVVWQNLVNGWQLWYKEKYGRLKW